MSKFNIGDKVHYSKSFLQSTGLIASEEAHANGVIENIKQINNRIQLITVKWNIDLPNKILNTNLSKIGGVSND